MENHRLLLEPDELTPEERLDALAKVLAEGLIYLDQNGLLELDSEEESNTATPEAPPTKIPQKLPLTSVGKEGKGSLLEHEVNEKNHGGR